MTQFRQLMPHQRRGLSWAIQRRPQRLPIFWEMRLGKTLLTLRWLDRMQHYPALVVCPLSVLPVWGDEADNEGLEWVDLHDKKMRQALYDGELSFGHHLYLINYEAVRNDPRILNYEWGACVLDESPIIKNPQAKITRTIIDGTKHIRNKAILSGLPTPEGLDNIFTQFQFLYGHCMGHSNFWSWRRHYYNKHFAGFGWQPAKGTVQAIKEEIASRGTVLTRKTAGIGSSIVTMPRYCEIPPAVQREYLKAEKEFALSDGRSTKWKVVVDNWLRQICCGPHKDKLLFEVLNGDLKTEKTVIWFAFKADLKRIRDLLRKQGRPVFELHGDIPKPDRKIQVKKFNQPGANVILATPASGRYGLDFSASDTAIYYSLAYSHEQYKQSKDRIVHPMKNYPLMILHLLCRGTIEEDILTALRTKDLEGGHSMRPVWDATQRRMS